MHIVAAYSVSMNGEETDCGGQSYMKCDPGYVLKGSVTSDSEICENFGSGSRSESGSGSESGSESESGELPSCVPLNCSKNISDYATILPSCDMKYQCTVSCDKGFTEDNVTYLCNVTSDPTMVDWVLVSEVDVLCERGL